MPGAGSDASFEPSSSDLSEEELPANHEEPGAKNAQERSSANQPAGLDSEDGVLSDTPPAESNPEVSYHNASFQHPILQSPALPVWLPLPLNLRLPHHSNLVSPPPVFAFQTTSFFSLGRRPEDVSPRDHFDFSTAVGGAPTSDASATAKTAPQGVPALEEDVDHRQEDDVENIDDGIVDIDKFINPREIFHNMVHKRAWVEKGASEVCHAKHDKFFCRQSTQSTIRSSQVGTLHDLVKSFATPFPDAVQDSYLKSVSEIQKPAPPRAPSRVQDEEV
eukprot:1194575-Pleurochrysis_carterae.AAC.1